MTRREVTMGDRETRDIIRAAEAAVMAGAARERERRVHRWECARCHIAQETPKAPEVAPDGCVYCPRCAEAIRPYAATPQQLAGIDDVSPRAAKVARLLREREEREKGPAQRPIPKVVPPEFQVEEKIQAEARAVRPIAIKDEDDQDEPDVRPDTSRPAEDVRSDTKPEEKEPTMTTTTAPPVAKTTPTNGTKPMAHRCDKCNRAFKTPQALGGHRSACGKPAPGPSREAIAKMLATRAAKKAAKLAAKSAPPTPAPSGTITSGWAQEIRIDPPTGATFVVDMKRGPIARFAGVEVELGSVEDAVAFVRAMQTSGQQSAAGSVSAKG